MQAMRLLKNRLMVAASAVFLGCGPAVSAQTSQVNSRATALVVEELAALEHPWSIEVLPDGALLLTEKPGRLRLWTDGQLSAPIAGVPEVVFRDQGGLLDVAIDPDFGRNRLIYLAYSEAGSTPPESSDVPDPRLGVFQDLTDGVPKGLAVARARLAGNSLDDVTVIWRAEKTIGRGHFGGRLAFASDGSLLVSSGDRQRFEPAQDPASDLGKILRIRATDGAPVADNPFAAGPLTHRDVWSLGHRNPLGLAVRSNGEVWVAEMGPQNGDELNVSVSGENYGWPVVSEGDHYNATSAPRHSTQPRFQGPRVSFPLAISPAALTFYDADRIGDWRGNVLVAALNRPGLVRGVPAADGVHDLEHIELGFRVRDIQVADDGSLLVLRDGPQGALVRVSPAAR